MAPTKYVYEPVIDFSYKIAVDRNSLRVQRRSYQSFELTTNITTSLGAPLAITVPVYKALNRVMNAVTCVNNAHQMPPRAITSTLTAY